MEGLAHAVIGDLTKIGEGRLRGYGAEVRMGREGLQELRRSHGFSKAVDAAGMSLGIEEVDPLMDVIALEETVGC